MATMTLQGGVLGGTARQSPSYFRRRTARVDASESVYTFWSCGGRENLSRVRDLGPSGLFIESPLEENIDSPVKLQFLVDEGQIRANAVVRHVKQGKGLGLKFVAINNQDGQRLADLIKRLQGKFEACCAGAGGR